MGFIYCLSLSAKAIDPIRPRGGGGCGITILKPTMATHLHYYSNASPIDVIRPQLQQLHGDRMTSYQLNVHVLASCVAGSSLLHVYCENST